MGLPLTAEEKKDALVDQLVARVRERSQVGDEAPVARFARNYYRRVGPDDLLGRSVDDLYGAVMAHWHLAQRRRAGERLLRVYNPRVEEHGWRSTHTIVEVVQGDTPFLVDSVRMELNRQGLTVHLIIHPVMALRRDEHGRVSAVGPEHDGTPGDAREALMHFEVDRQTEPAALERLEEGIGRVLDDVAAAVEDWGRMRERLGEAADGLSRCPPPVAEAEREEAQAFLRWLDHDSFTFLGYREYRLEREAGELHLRALEESGLGIAREPRGAVRSGSFERLPRAIRKLALRPDPLLITKGSSRATVHRTGYLDYIGVRRFDEEGNVVGEARFLGRFTSSAYTSRPADIPLLRRKVAQVMEWSQLRPGSHSAKALLNILETLPRDELFQAAARELFGMAAGILHLQERQQVRLLVRHDPFHRFLSCLVYLPRERFNTDVRLRVQELLQRAFDAESMDFAVSVGESTLARLYLTVHTGGNVLPDYSVREIERHIVAATRTWSDELHDALLQELGEETGNRLFARYREAFPASYREDYSPVVAVQDIREMEALERPGALGVLIYRPLETPAGCLRIKLIRREEPIALTTVLPMLENMGVAVSDERPHQVHPRDATPLWVHDLGMQFEQDEQVDTDRIRHGFREAFIEVWNGAVENDGFNRLVLHARCHWRQAALLRACCKYLLQTEFPFSQRYMEQVLSAQPQITRMLVDLFHARFDPAGRETSRERCERLADAILHSLEAIPNLDEDRILRRFYLLIQAMLRTNYYQRDAAGACKPYIAFKLDPRGLPDLPEPRPRYEIFVYSPAMEGVHLRGGKVARGGLRWSDRPEDFRTEVFGLMKAQMVKNAVIVPVGAKGGFVIKQGNAREEVLAGYRTFIRGLLDLTDNLDGARLVPPPDTVRWDDDDDPYLVVAADKGTATFSDTANAVAAEYGFWLGDAFASGGSTGYDHKKMGITARGAWESVRRHFREFGLDVQSTDFTVVGIGSMNGDVFGNGMLLSPHIRLVAAFSHQHVFLDPEPDPAVSFAERRRLFELPGSSWDDYDRERISAGGGVWSRKAKSIPLSPQVRARLGVEAEELAPNDLVRAILRAPVDLLWNGGIGTFVKAGDESHEAVGDRANDAVRIDALQLRCKVVGEGGNLGLTQRARIEFARAGGRINSDFIDNSGGVDCSDHEVNIKILLHGPVNDGRLGWDERNRLLVEMREGVAEQVLRNNRHQCEALSLAERLAPQSLPEHAGFLRALERSGYLERANWALPDEEALDARRRAGEGLARPELAVLLAYAKIALFEELLRSDLAQDQSLAGELADYFPARVVERYGDELPKHRLRPELIASFIANHLVNRLGITAAHRVAELSGSDAPEIARAFMATRRIFDLPGLWSAITSHGALEADAELAGLAEASRLVRRATLWLLRNAEAPLDVPGAVAAYGAGVAALAERLEELLDPADRHLLEQRRRERREQGLEPGLADRMAALPFLFSALDITYAANQMGQPVHTVARLYFALGAALGLNWMRDRIAELSVEDHWSRLAREALREELYRLHRGLTVDALTVAGDDGDPAAAMSAWTTANQAAVEHYQRRVEQFRAGPEADLALLSVAANELRKLARARAPGE